jgi:GntR family transcriptional regulator/MocR family aminotransferase
VDLEMEFRPGVPLRRQLEGALRVAIRSGRLAPGSVLPPSRDLAEELGVSRGVVVDSYAQLTTEGYVTAKRGSGTRVALLPASGTAPAMRARRSGVGVHELHRHCTTHASSPPALLLGFALPSESELITATRLLAEAIC